MAKMEKKIGKLNMYRVYGHQGGDAFDEYAEASTAQQAADRVREWRSYGSDDKVCVEEVSKVLTGWK